MKIINKYKNVIKILLLIIFFSGNILTSVKAVIVGAFIYVFSGKSIKKYIDFNFILFLVFFLFYYLISQFDVQNKTEFNMQYFFVPPILYLSGKWLGDKDISSIVIVRALWLIGFALASMTLKIVFTDILNYGFVGGVRNIATSGSDKELSATILAGALVLLAAYSGVVFTSSALLNKTDRVLIIIAVFICLGISARLGSRTIIFIVAISIILGILINLKHYRKKEWFFFVFSIIIIGYLIATYVSADIFLLNYYLDRADSNDVGISTFGGRVEKWTNALYLLVDNPMGWGIVENGHSHNFWLDVARNGGIIPLIISGVMTFIVGKTFFKSISRNSCDIIYRTAATCISSSYLLIFMLEPILDGFSYVFYSFCCFWGVLQTYKSSNTSLRNK